MAELKIEDQAWSEYTRDPRIALQTFITGHSHIARGPVSASKSLNQASCDLIVHPNQCRKLLERLNNPHSEPGRVGLNSTSARSAVSISPVHKSSLQKYLNPLVTATTTKLLAQLQAGHFRRARMTGSVRPALDDVRIRSRADKNTDSMLVRKRASSYSFSTKASKYGSGKGSTGVTKIHDLVSCRPGTLGLVWSYRTEPTVDKSLREAGVWLWNHTPTYYQPLAQVAVQGEEQLEIAPLVVLASKSGKTQPTIVFTGSHVLVQPHFPHWPDPRAHITHPDFLPSTRLAAYQACEVAGYRVWRHDRDSFVCALRGCQKLVSDFGLQTRVCIGCGPRSCIRYCCHKHEFQDFRVHWRACGSSSLVSPFVIDHCTAPAYFSNLCPAICEVGQHRSFQIHRQRYFACHSRGHYTLFGTTDRENLVLQWPREHPAWQEMESRIERLLNIGFLDSSRYNLLGYLYGILRHLLLLTTAYIEPLLCNLKRQFTSEFGEAVLREIDLQPIFPCECAWLGQQLPPSRHLANCDRKFVPQDPHGDGFLGITSQLEAQYWILRAWMQQHPTVPDWRKRAEGEGFELGPNSAVVKLGPGFVGWGAEPCNSCG